MPDGLSAGADVGEATAGLAEGDSVSECRRCRVASGLGVEGLREADCVARRNYSSETSDKVQGAFRMLAEILSFRSVRSSRADNGRLPITGDNRLSCALLYPGRYQSFEHCGLLPKPRRVSDGLTTCRTMPAPRSERGINLALAISIKVDASCCLMGLPWIYTFGSCAHHSHIKARLDLSTYLCCE